jgi:hypothetical protein
MTCLVTLATALLLAAPADAPQDPRALAQDLLTKGAALFDQHDAATMAATYVEDAEVNLYIRDRNTGAIKTDTRRSRSTIQAGYVDVFKDATPSMKSRNVVTSAEMLESGLLVIHGTFTPNTAKPDSVSFVQVRVKDGDAWRILNLQLFVGWK